MICEPIDGIHQHEHEEAVRMVGFKTATYLGKAGANVEPDEVKTYETKPLLEQVKEYPDLPKVSLCIHASNSRSYFMIHMYMV